MKKNVLVNKYKKQMCCNENLYFFEVMRNSQIFPPKVCHFKYDHRFVFSREMENIRTCRKVRLQKLNKFRLSGWYSFWDFLTCLKTKNHLGRRNFSSPFLQNIKFCSYEVLFQLHFKTTRYFDGHV